MDRDFALVQRLDVIAELCRGRKVLHLGCTNWPYTLDSLDKGLLLHNDLQSIAGDLWGIDADQEGIDTLTARGFDQIVFGDLERLDKTQLSGTFDVIVAGEMIEHLNNPGLFLGGVQRFMSDDSLLLLTTINAYCGMRFFQYGIRGKRGSQEPVHPDHVAYYSFSTLSKLLERHELSLQNFLYYDMGREHRPYQKRILRVINDVCVWFAPQWADGVIATAKRAGVRS